MATQVGEATVALKFDTKGAASKLKSETSQALDESKARVSAWGVAVGNLISSTFQKVASVISQNLDGAISRVDTLNNAKKMFTAMGYSVGGVNKTMKMLDSYLDGLPTALDDAVEGVQSLSASFGGINIGTKAFKAVNDAGLAFGATSDQIKTAITQLSQTSLDGPLDAQTWNSLRNSGFSPVFAAMAKEAGITVAELKDQFGGNGTRTVRQFMEELIKLDEEGGASMKSLTEMARTNTDGIGTALTNLQTRIKRMIAGVIDAIGASRISGAINDFSKKLVQAGVDFGKKIADLLKDKKIKTFLRQVGEAAKDAFDGIKTAAKAAWEIIYRLFTDGTLGYAIKAFGKMLKVVGDAMLAISKNKAAVSALQALLAAFATYKTVAAAADAVNVFSGKLSALSTILKGGTLATNIGKVATATSQTGAIASAASGPLAGLATTIGQFAIPAALAAGAGVALGTSLANIALQHKAAKDGLAGVREAADKLKNANQQLKTSQDELKTAQNDAVSSLDTLRSAEKNAKDVAAQHGMTLDQAKEYVGKLSLSSDDLTDKDIALYTAVSNLKTAEEERKDALDGLKIKTEELAVAEKTRNDAMAAAETAALTRSTTLVAKKALEQGKYEDIVDILKRLQSEYDMTGKINGQSTSLTKDQVHEALDSIGKDLGNLGTLNSNEWRKIWEAADGNIYKIKTDTAKKAGEAGTQVITDFSNGASSKLPALQTNFNNIGIQGANSLKSGIDTGKSSAADMILKNAQNANNKSGTLNSTMSNVGKQGANALTRSMSSSHGYAAGANVVQGAINGANSRSGGLWATLSSIADGAISSFKKVFNIKSPSKVMMQQGAYIVEGLVIGLQKGQKEVDAEMATLASSMIGAGGFAVSATTLNAPTVHTIAQEEIIVRGEAEKAERGNVYITMENKINNELDAEDIGRRINNSIRLATS